MTTGLVVLVSGGGRSLENLVEVARRGELDARVDLVVADRPGVGALERCARLGVDAVVLEPKALGGMAEFSREVFRRADALGARIVVLAGFLRLLAVPDHWRGRVINIHPALLPDFGGKGMYGDHVHAAVLASGRTESGCTVHLVDDRYDEGAILLQAKVPVLRDDTVASLAARVFEAEKLALPEALRRIIASDRETSAP